MSTSVSSLRKTFSNYSVEIKNLKKTLLSEIKSNIKVVKNSINEYININKNNKVDKGKSKVLSIISLDNAKTFVKERGKEDINKSPLNINDNKITLEKRNDVYLDMTNAGLINKLRNQDEYILSSDMLNCSHINKDRVEYLNDNLKDNNKITSINNDIVENGYIQVNDNDVNVEESNILDDNISNLDLDDFSLIYNNDFKENKKYRDIRQSYNEFIELPNKVKVAIQDIIKDKSIFNHKELSKKKEDIIDYISTVIVKSNKFKLTFLPEKNETEVKLKEILKEKIKDKINQEMEGISLYDRLTLSNKEEFGYVIIEKLVGFLDKYKNNKDIFQMENKAEYKKCLDKLYQDYGLNNLNKRIDDILYLQYWKFEQKNSVDIGAGVLKEKEIEEYKIINSKIEGQLDIYKENNGLSLQQLLEKVKKKIIG